MIERFKIIEDKPVLHRAEAQGERVVRTQKILDTQTGNITTVNWFADWQTGKITRIQ